MHAGQTATENDAPSAAAPHALAAAPVLPEYYLSQLTFVCIYALVGMGLMLLTGHRPDIARPWRLPGGRRVYGGGVKSISVGSFQFDAEWKLNYLTLDHRARKET